MHKFLEYTILFATVLLLQIFLFSNISLGVYIRPMVYLTFIVLLPLDMRWGWIVMMGLMTGLVMDMALGDNGLNVIATVAAAFSRPLLLYSYIAGDDSRESGIPNSRTLGQAKFFRYALYLTFIHNAIFFMFEVHGLDGYWHVLLRIILSTIFTSLIIYVIQLLFFARRNISRR